jgi:hypothetical protein
MSGNATIADQQRAILETGIGRGIIWPVGLGMKSQRAATQDLGISGHQVRLS